MRFGPEGQVTVNAATRAGLLAEVARRLDRGEGFALATLNVDHLVKLRRDPAFAAAYATLDLVTADGNPVVWLSRLGGQPVELIPGSDLIVPLMRVAAAKLKFRRRSVSDRRDAVKELVDVLEFIRDDAKAVLTSKDHSDLFNLANNFGIRHHTKDQKTDYDLNIWLSWMFYHYLATIHACVRLIEKAKKAQPSPPAPRRR